MCIGSLSTIPSKGFFFFFFPSPLSFLFSFLLFLTQPSFREARSARSQLHRAHLGSSSLRLPYPITCPPCKLIYLTRIADTIDARLLGSARIIRSFPRTLSSRRKIHASRLNNDPSIDPTIAILLPLHSSSLNDLLPTASRLPLPLFARRLFRSSRLDRTLNLERGSIGANYSSPTPLDSALMSHHHHCRRRSNLLPGKYPLNLARAVRWQLR